MKLLKESKLTRYLLYAVGEIILVVFGILIALQINAWSNENQNRALEKTSLENLREDLVIQKEIIQSQLDYESIMLAQVDSCREYLKAQMDVKEVDRLLYDLASRKTFVANRATFDNMGSTGEVVLIKDPELQNSLVRYYQQLDYTKSVVNNNNLFMTDSQFGTFVFNNGLGFGLEPDGSMATDYVMNPEQRFLLKSQLAGRESSSNGSHGVCSRQMETTDALIGMIDESLKAQ